MEAVWDAILRLVQDPTAWIGIGLVGLCIGALARGIAGLVTAVVAGLVALTAIGFNLHDVIPWL